MPLVRALLELGHLSERVLEEELSRSGAPVLRSVTPLVAIIEELPPDLCRHLLAIPVRRDPRTGAVDVAAVNPFDSHIAEEFAYHLKSEVHMLRASLLAIEEALAIPSLGGGGRRLAPALTPPVRARPAFARYSAAPPPFRWCGARAARSP